MVSEGMGADVSMGVSKTNGEAAGEPPMLLAVGLCAEKDKGSGICFTPALCGVMPGSGGGCDGGDGERVRGKEMTGTFCGTLE